MSTKQYDKKFTIQYHLKLNIKTDNDIINYLKKTKNKQGLIKKLIRDEIKDQEKSLKQIQDQEDYSN